MIEKKKSNVHLICYWDCIPVCLLDVSFKVTLWLSYRVCKLWEMPKCRNHADLIRMLSANFTFKHELMQSINKSNHGWIDKSIDQNK